MNNFSTYCLDLAAQLDVLRGKFANAVQYETDIVLDSHDQQQLEAWQHDESMLLAVKYLRRVAERHEARVQIGTEFAAQRRRNGSGTVQDALIRGDTNGDNEA